MGEKNHERDPKNRKSGKLYTCKIQVAYHQGFTTSEKIVDELKTYKPDARFEKVYVNKNQEIVLKTKNPKQCENIKQKLPSNAFGRSKIIESKARPTAALKRLRLSFNIDK